MEFHTCNFSMYTTFKLSEAESRELDVVQAEAQPCQKQGVVVVIRKLEVPETCVRDRVAFAAPPRAAEH